MSIELERFLGVSLKDLPKAEHKSIERRLQEGLHTCVCCGGGAQTALLGEWPPPLDRQPGFWVDLCAKDEAALRLHFLDKEMDK